MAEDRLEKAITAMKNEKVDPERLEEARSRVWEKLEGQGETACLEFRPKLKDYLSGQIQSSARLLIEDHLSRCPHCRSKLAELKGDRPAALAPPRSASKVPKWGKWLAAAAILFAAVYLGRSQIDRFLALGGPRATVAAVNGNLYLVPEGELKSGAEIGEGETIRTGPDSNALLELPDGTRIEVNERSELTLQAAWSGRMVELQRGDIIIQAAKQRHGYLRVQTRDSVASVKGTVFAVSAGLSGTVVSVIEGSVAVAQTGTDVVLNPGEQITSNPALESSAQQAVSWSSDADTYTQMLASLVQIEKQLAELPAPAMRTQSNLLQYIPANTIVYGAIPNLGSTINQALQLVEIQSAENPAFGQWWNSSEGQTLRYLLHQIEALTHLLGAEIVYGYSFGDAGENSGIPIVLAEIKPGKQAELEGAIDSLTRQGDPSQMAYQMTDTLIAISSAQDQLRWLLNNLGTGSESAFAEEIAEHYERGTGWLFGMDMDSIMAQRAMIQSAVADAKQVKHLFLEHRDVAGIEENEVVLTFKGPRTGLASFLANSGSGGAAEYISSDAVASAYISTREPYQIFNELMALMGRSNPSSPGDLTQMEAMLGVSFADDFAASMGTESAFGLETVSLSGPVWVMAVLVHNPVALDLFIAKMVDAANAEWVNDQVEQPVRLVKEDVDGRTWTTLQSPRIPFAITWTYDRGYMVAASDRGAALRAIANRSGGSSLVWSQTFQRHLAASAGLHPSGFVWFNTKGAFQSFAALVPNATLQKLLAERDPILVAFSAEAEQIRAVSRTRLSGLIMDIMLLQGLGRTQAEAP